jgi:hypothetical protein
MRDLSLHLMDILQNSISAKSTCITVMIRTHLQDDILTVRIEDNGAGMDKELLKQVTDPFITTRTTRRIGLGIPLFKESAERAGGSLSLDSLKGKGTVLEASFRISHIDRLPLGDMADTIAGVLIAEQDVDIELVLNSDKKNFVFNSREIREKLGEVPIHHSEVIAWIREYINEGVNITFGGVLNEITG